MKYIIKPGTYFVYNPSERYYVALDSFEQDRPIITQCCRALDNNDEFTFIKGDLPHFKIVSQEEGLAQII